MTKRWPLAAVLLAAVAIAAAVFSLVRVRSDLADLLPSGQTAASRVMLEELRSGAASSLMLIGLEGAAPEKLASISRAMAEILNRNPLFRFVNNGQQILDAKAEADLFAHRYLLSPATTAGSFEVPALRRDFQNLLAGLQSSASPLVQQFGLPDPTSTFTSMIASLAGESRVRTIDSVWFAPDRDRALMLVQTQADGLDLTAEDQAIAAVQEAIKLASAGTAPNVKLLISGPAVFARDAAHGIRADVRLLSSVSALLVTSLLFWRFRSLLVVAVIAVPLVLAAAAGALAVQLGFGFVHGITLGFGMTMLGVAVDYPILLIGHRKIGEPAFGTLRRIGAAFNLAVVSAALGLTGLMFSRFPGLSQLGVFSVAGILTAAAVTRFVLPRLIVAADLAPVSAGDPALLARIEPWRRWRLAGVLAVAGAVCLFLISGGPRWERDLAHLSPVPAQALALDAELRTELGAPDVGQMLVVQGVSEDAVLAREETLTPIVSRLILNRTITGADTAAALLPSLRTQAARQSVLPDASTLAARVAEASQGLGFTASAFLPYMQDVAAARTMKPVTPHDLPGKLLAARLDALLFDHDGTWFGVIAPHGLHDPAALQKAFTGQENVTYVDVGGETNGVVQGFTRQAWPWLAGGAAAATAVLAIGLQDFVRLARVLGSIAAALLVTIAILMLARAKFSIIHVVALQFVAGIGLDYALFFSRERLDAEERSRTLRTLFTCNAMALLTFGLLCLCHTPLLRDIGTTVAIGVAAAMLFAFLFAGPLHPESS